MISLRRKLLLFSLGNAMQIAALITGIIALILAIIATAPFFMIVTVIGIPAGVLALVFSLMGIAECGWRRYRGLEVTDLGHALMGGGLGIVSLGWTGLWAMIYLKSMAAGV